MSWKHPIEGNPIHFTLNVDTEEAEAQLARLQARIAEMEAAYANLQRFNGQVGSKLETTCTVVAGAAVVAGAKLSRRQLLGLAWRRG